MWEKENYVRGTFLSPQKLFFKSQVRKWVLNLVFKFHNNPTVNKSGIVVLLGQVYLYAGKRKGFKREGRENEFEIRESVETYRKCKN